MSNVAQGKKVGIVGQLKCPDGSLRYVRAIVRDDQGTLVATIDLSDEGRGKFTGEVTMPDRPWIEATLTTYTDPGYTVEDEEYCDLVQSFQRDDGGEASGGGQKDEEIAGFVSSSIITGDVSVDILLKGSINDSNLIGQIDQAPSLSGSLDSQELVGIVNCE